jgi:hypothetical protein
MSWTCRAKALIASRASIFKTCFTFEGGQCTSVCLIAASPYFFFLFFTNFLYNDRNESQPECQYYYSLDHNDKTWKHGATPPLARHEIIDELHSYHSQTSA